MSDLVGSLADLLGYLTSGHPSKSKFVRWVARLINGAIVMLIVLVLYRVYST